MKKQMNCKLASLCVKINYNSDYIYNLCKDYITDEERFDIAVSVSDEKINAEQEAAPNARRDYCESLCIYREIAENLPCFDRFVFHGAAISYGGKGYLFTAPSGTGKTTHINLWRENLGEKVEVINGDKPIIKADETPVIYGTPWAGKERMHSNISAPLEAICIIKRGKVNKICRLGVSDALSHLMRQFYIPHNKASLEKTLSLMGTLLENTPVYLLECDMSDQAFKTSFEALTKEQK